MTKHPAIEFQNPIMLVGFFYVCILLSGCLKATDPEDVTKKFWLAISENNLSNAQKNCLQANKFSLDKTLHNLRLQTGKVIINYDYATVETSLQFQAVGNKLNFKTYLQREAKTDHWKVDYKKTMALKSSSQLKALIPMLKTLIDSTITPKLKSIWNKITQAITKQINKLKHKWL